MNQNRKLSVRSIWAKFQNFEVFSNNAFVLFDYLWSNFQQDRTMYGKYGPKKQKVSIS